MNKTKASTILDGIDGKAKKIQEKLVYDLQNKVRMGNKEEVTAYVAVALVDLINAVAKWHDTETAWLKAEVEGSKKSFEMWKAEAQRWKREAESFQEESTTPKSKMSYEIAWEEASKSCLELEDKNKKLERELARHKEYSEIQAKRIKELAILNQNQAQALKDRKTPKYWENNEKLNTMNRAQENLIKEYWADRDRLEREIKTFEMKEKEKPLNTEEEIDKAFINAGNKAYSGQVNMTYTPTTPIYQTQYIGSTMDPNTANAVTSNTASTITFHDQSRTT